MSAAELVGGAEESSRAFEAAVAAARALGPAAARGVDVGYAASLGAATRASEVGVATRASALGALGEAAPLRAAASAIRHALHVVAQHTGLPVAVVAALALVLSWRLAKSLWRLALELAFALALVLLATKLGWIRW